MRIYISGAITGPMERGEDYKQAFKTRAYELRKAGYTPVNPLDYQSAIYSKYNGRPTHEDFMNELLKVLLDCEGITMLDNWTESAVFGADYRNSSCQSFNKRRTGAFLTCRMKHKVCGQ